jgi:hypothetical protein
VVGLVDSDTGVELTSDSPSNEWSDGGE